MRFFILKVDFLADEWNGVLYCTGYMKVFSITINIMLMQLDTFKQLYI